MYELSLARSVSNTVLGLCEKSGWSRVRHVVLKIGGMRRVNPELMSFIFGMLSLGTPAEGANFSIMFLPVLFHCHSCGRDSERDDTEFACPLCGSRDVTLMSGLELAIELLEVER